MLKIRTDHVQSYDVQPTHFWLRFGFVTSGNLIVRDLACEVFIWTDPTFCKILLYPALQFWLQLWILVSLKIFSFYVNFIYKNVLVSQIHARNFWMKFSLLGHLFLMKKRPCSLWRKKKVMNRKWKNLERYKYSKLKSKLKCRVK